MYKKCDGNVGLMIDGLKAALDYQNMSTYTVILAWLTLKAVPISREITS